MTAIYRLKRQNIEAESFKELRLKLTEIIKTDDGLRSLVSGVGFKWCVHANAMMVI